VGVTAAQRPAKKSSRSGLPPGPPLPSLVQGLLWARQAKRFFCACQDRYGDTFTLRLMHVGTLVLVSDPEHVKQVFMGDPRIFLAGQAAEVMRPFVGDNSLLVLDKDAHMTQRKLLLPPLHGERMQAYGRAMEEIAARDINTWPTGIPYRVRPRMQAITLEVILCTVFGVREGARKTELRDSLRACLDLTSDVRFMLPIVALGPSRASGLRFFRDRIQQFDRLIYREIAERRTAGGLEERDDILSLLIGARHEDGSPMSDREIRDQLLTLLAAGHETTATSLAWAVERLARHPEKLERLREEVEAGSDAYLTATIQETLRLRPVFATVARRLAEPVEIGGNELPAGVTVTPSPYLVHRNPEIYPEPDRFYPERFLKNPPGTYTWIPFGGGTRRCIGASFSQFEMAVVLRELVKRRRIRPAKQKSESIFRRGVVETPRHNAEVILN
jgi:cytochrome P450 family 135